MTELSRTADGAWPASDRFRRDGHQARYRGGQRRLLGRWEERAAGWCVSIIVIVLIIISIIIAIIVIVLIIIIIIIIIIIVIVLVIDRSYYTTIATAAFTFLRKQDDDGS